MAGFVLEKYLTASRKLDLDGIDFGAVRDHPLSETEVRCLTYMMDIESHTIIYLKDLLSTRAAEDREVTAFLSLWVYEEFWHGHALERFLRAAGQQIQPDRIAQTRRGARGSALLQGMKDLASARMSQFIPLHMAWGALNELTTLNGYSRIIATTKHPILVELLKRIIKDERRHYAFYFNQARMRLDVDRSARTVTRWVLGRFWSPVGTGVRPQEETDFVVTALFSGPDGMRAIASMEHDITKLPGLNGLRLLSKAVAAAKRRSRVHERSSSSLSDNPLRESLDSDRSRALISSVQ